MSTWHLTRDLRLTFPANAASSCFAYACRETSRLLERLGIRVHANEEESSDKFWLLLGEPGQSMPGTDGIRHDGYVLSVRPRGAWITAPTAKGVLNAVYDLAERIGFLFLMPGIDGEWAPECGNGLPAIEAGEWRRVPRFPHRGIFGGLTIWPHTEEEWLRFFAKLRFNAQSHHPENADLAGELGIRLEAGGHGMASLLPRDLFETQPELFRMFQPEDFGGKRQPDANFCPTHPETERIVTENVRRQFAGMRDVYAVHAWADDLPGGGWCLCPRCRSFSPPDQSQLAMNMQARAIAQDDLPMRVPVIAYHDTMYPGTQVMPRPECFLLFAPRERCYGHALDDPGCAKNRWYFGALKAWMERFANHDDAHTFEYYCDQILYRGLYPFLPDVIVGDMAAYRSAGIESHMSLQVGGALLAPDYNLLVFARAHWDADLSPDGFIAWLAARLDPSCAEAWQRYLESRRQAFTPAMALCGIANDIYYDYRFPPETTHRFGDTMVQSQQRGAALLRQAGEALAAAADGMAPRTRELAGREAARAHFEAEDLVAMSLEQAGLNLLGRYHSQHEPSDLQQAMDMLGRATDQLHRADAAASASGMPDEAYYHAFNRDWAGRELREKIAVYRGN